MTVVNRGKRSDTAPALYRLLEESALSRAALGCCGVPVAMVEACGKGRALTYVNAAFEAFFGYRESESLGKQVAALLFRNDEPLMQRVFDAPRKWELTAWAKDGAVRPVELALAGVRSADGQIAHWVLAFSDRGEVEKLRAEVESLKTLAASSLGVRLEPAEPSRVPQHARIDVPAPDDLYAAHPPVLHRS